jgi:hypothetical protein
MIGLWCNGSTTDFDSVCLGSNPSNPTEKQFSNELLFLLGGFERLIMGNIAVSIYSKK